ncbi:MAG: HlyD family efflux transporter periplasmic adaptor subunit [Sulfurovum sp.]|nr:HlyD family efflux transporter periplasmic adaptor subunit [Sulfurovum sp.]MDD3602825.1 HlyD family efflux transporter periplasmic adaptor subunit [Sulfurovum sp.]
MSQEKLLPYKMIIHPYWMTFGTLFLIIVPFFIWASYAHLDQISHAQGQVIAAAKTQEIQSAIDGVIEQIDVREGDHVKKGDILVVLEKSQAFAAYEDRKAKVAALQAALVRLQAEVYDKPLIFPSSLQEYPEFVENQTALFHRRQQALNDDLSALNESLKLAKEELNLNLPLLKSGDIGATEIIKLKRQIAELKGKISNTRNKYFQDSQTEMTKAEEDLSTRGQELTDKLIILERTTISSPMNAIVKNIIFTTQGAKVRPGDVILELVPFGDELIIEAKLRPADISFVKPGQNAAIKLDAYDYSIYGIFHGKVKYISPDTLIEKTPKGDEYYFRVLIVLDQTQLIAKNGKKIDMSPGMTAQVDIVTGNKSVLAYLSKPITKTFSEAFHER